MAGGERKQIMRSMRNVSLLVDRSTLSGASGGASREGVDWGVVGPFSTKQEIRAMAITWNAERMSTGVHEVDEQHQELIRHFNEFHEAFARSTSGSAAVSLPVVEAKGAHSSRHAEE